VVWPPLRVRVIVVLVAIASIACTADGSGNDSPSGTASADSSTASEASPSEGTSEPTSAPEGPDVTSSEFITPSGNIWCEVEEPWLNCNIGSGLNPEPSAEFCGADWAGLFIEPGRFAGPACSGDQAPTVSPDALVLEYGQTWKHGQVRCTSRSTGLRCVDKSGYGFTLARAGWELLGKEAAAREAFGDLTRLVRMEADLDRPGEVESVLSPDLRFADDCGPLQEGVAQVEFTDTTHALYTACFVSGTWFMTAGPLYVD
jgi:hypothetical protein